MSLTTRAAAPILPPRPNLGPEPWPESPWPTGWLAGLAALLIVAALGILRHRRRSRLVAATGDGPSPTLAAPDDPQERLIRAADAARAALVARLGPPWVARTTEEIAEAPEPVAWLGVARAGRLVELLRSADRAKFAGPTTAAPTGEDHWESFVAELVAEAAAGPSSRIKGK